MKLIGHQVENRRKIISVSCGSMDHIMAKMVIGYTT